ACALCWREGKSPMLSMKIERASTITERLVTLTERLVAFPTVAHEDAALRACVAWVREHVETRVPGLQTRLVVSGGKPALLFTRGERSPRILLAGHLDVVAADPGAFSMRRGGGWLLGRGVADMKGPVAALLDLFETESRSGLGLLLTTDEENGGKDGAR